MNYHSMAERNREAGRQMAEMAVQVIRDMVQRGEKVKVTELVRRTGFPGHFFTGMDMSGKRWKKQRKPSGPTYTGVSCPRKKQM